MKNLVAVALLGAVVVAFASCSSSDATSPGGNASGGSAGQGGFAGSAGSVDASATGGVAGTSGTGAGGSDSGPGGSDSGPDPGPSRFTPGSTHHCSESDAGSGANQEQTGWPGFCDRSALWPIPGYVFQVPASYWKTAFDARWADVDAMDGRAKSTARATSCQPCDQDPYYLHVIFKSLLTMYRATGDGTYVEDAVQLADLMIAAAVPYDPAWASPVDPAAFASWVATQGELRYWNADACGPAGVSGYRYQLNELQGLRGISELSRVLKEQGDARWSKYFDYADQVVSFYAMLGNGNPNIDSGGDKRDHYIINALDLYAASGETRFRDWATVILGPQLSEVYKDLGDYLEIHVGTGSYSTTILDVSHANRDAELFRYLQETAWPGTSDTMRKAVNTLLFKIWEDDPGIALDTTPDYPTLFRSYTDGTNACASGTNPPYRLGSVVFGWNELSRYDRRVLYLMETLAMGLVDGTVIKTFPASGGCTANGNTNYSYVGEAAAEMAYVQKLFGAAP